MSVFKHVEARGHENVAFFYNPALNFKAIIAVHDTVLGPSLGGCRMRMYDCEEAALDDVLRLSEGMTYKNSLAGLDIGGGKACIIGDHTVTEGRAEIFREFGRCVDRLAGTYISAEDMGTSVSDMEYSKEMTPHITGKDDPSPWTAKGVFAAIKIASEIKFGSADLTGRHVTLQGAGHVGQYLLTSLSEAGAKITVTDTSADSVRQAVDKFGATGVDVDGIYDVPCDIYCPCAIGQTVNHDTLKRLQCSVIAGAANNQLIDLSVAEVLKERDILYCPDYLINAGGVISCAAELEPGGWKEGWVLDKLGHVEKMTAKVLSQATETGRFTEEIALELAKERIESVASAKAA